MSEKVEGLEYFKEVLQTQVLDFVIMYQTNGKEPLISALRWAEPEKFI